VACAGQLSGVKVLLSVVVIDRVAPLRSAYRTFPAAALRPERCSDIVSTVVAARPPQAHPQSRSAHNSGPRCS